jgi:hypothetical protein
LSNVRGSSVPGTAGIRCGFFIPTRTVQPVLTLQTFPFLRKCQLVNF